MEQPLQTVVRGIHNRDPRSIARAITLVEQGSEQGALLLSLLDRASFEQSLLLGVTGSPGVGKSTLTNALIRRFREQGRRVAIIAIDPSSPISGGALLGDRIRMMSHALDRDVVLRSMATRGRLGGLCAAAGATARIMAAAGCSPVILETVGVGQSEMDIVRLADVTLMVLAPGLGDDIQAMKAGLLEVADLLVVNKADCRGADSLIMDLQSALRDRNDPHAGKVLATVASEGKGIGELVESIDTLARRWRDDGSMVRRRLASRRAEIVDWAIELLKPRLHEALENEQFGTSEPRQAAQALLARLFGD